MNLKTYSDLLNMNSREKTDPALSPQKRNQRKFTVSRTWETKNEISLYQWTPTMKEERERVGLKEYLKK